MFKDRTKTIQTNRLILRKFTITDADDMYNNWASDTECCKYLAWNVHKNIDETKALLESWIKAYDEGCYNWVVEIKNTHEIIGSISVMTALKTFYLRTRILLWLKVLGQWLCNRSIKSSN